MLDKLLDHVIHATKIRMIIVQQRIHNTIWRVPLPAFASCNVIVSSSLGSSSSGVSIRKSGS